MTLNESNPNQVTCLMCSYSCNITRETGGSYAVQTVHTPHSCTLLRLYLTRYQHESDLY